jgi:SAM-dependent methyltransferase
MNSKVLSILNMHFINTIKNIYGYLKLRTFLVTPISVLFNPYYIIRRGLYKSILYFSDSISGKTLDFGCGSKPYESIFKSVTHYVGVDIEKSGHNHKDSKVDLFYDGKTLPFSNASFDSVICFEVLEHVFNINEVISEIKRVLKPGGYLLISVPFAWDEHEAPYDFARYTSFGIQYIFEKNNFEIIELRKTTNYFLAIIQILINYFYQHVFGKSKIIKILLYIIFIMPFTLICLILNLFLPNRSEYYCNNVILMRKI